MYCELELELTESVTVGLTVHFHCTFAGCNATYYDPPEPPEFEVDCIEIDYLDGLVWEKDRQTLLASGWYDVAHEKALEALDNYDELYEHQIDAFNSHDPYDY